MSPPTIHIDVVFRIVFDYLRMRTTGRLRVSYETNYRIMTAVSVVRSALQKCANSDGEYSKWEVVRMGSKRCELQQTDLLNLALRCRV